MKQILKTILITSVIVCSTEFTHAQNHKFSARADSILKKYVLLRDNTDSTDKWNDYINIFPNCRKEFENIFNPDDFSELYNNSYEYITILEKAPNIFAEDIINLIFNITKDRAPGCCDAWSWLHELATLNAIKNTTIFFNSIKFFKSNEIDNIIKFLADKEAIKFSEEYQMIINNLNTLNEKDFVEKFEKARIKRILEKDH
jgi:hypothetical protein